jgi:ABC transporter substrate binding protein
MQSNRVRRREFITLFWPCRDSVAARGARAAAGSAMTGNTIGTARVACSNGPTVPVAFPPGSGKWLELLKQIAPDVTRVAVLGDPTTPTGPAQFGAIQALAPSLRVEVTSFKPRDPGEIERAVATFARASNGGLILTASGPALVHRDLIVTLAAQHKLPAVYFDRSFVAAGGLISYGPDRIEMYRQAAGYVDRILKGEKPADLPVQAPTKYETVLNLRTAKTLGLSTKSGLAWKERSRRTPAARECSPTAPLARGLAGILKVGGRGVLF